MTKRFGVSGRFLQEELCSGVDEDAFTDRFLTKNTVEEYREPLFTTVSGQSLLLQKRSQQIVGLCSVMLLVTKRSRLVLEKTTYRLCTYYVIRESGMNEGKEELSLVVW